MTQWIFFSHTNRNQDLEGQPCICMKDKPSWSHTSLVGNFWNESAWTENQSGDLLTVPCAFWSAGDIQCSDSKYEATERAKWIDSAETLSKSRKFRRNVGFHKKKVGLGCIRIQSGSDGFGQGVQISLPAYSCSGWPLLSDGGNQKNRQYRIKIENDTESSQSPKPTHSLTFMFPRGEIRLDLPVSSDLVHTMHTKQGHNHILWKYDTADCKKARTAFCERKRKKVCSGRRIWQITTWKVQQYQRSNECDRNECDSTVQDHPTHGPTNMNKSN